jgi:soluble cytochrome b562
MSDFETTLLNITLNATKIGDKLQVQKTEIFQLNAKVKYLSQENEELNKQILNQIEKLENSKLTSHNQLLTSRESENDKPENKEVKEKINELVKEIDKCIALLNN